MSHCKTCRHWGAFAGDDPKSGWGGCGRIEDDTNHTRDYKPKPGSIACVADAEGYSAWLTTHESFGCVLWEQETEETL
jgi:hypothetical protein